MQTILHAIMLMGGSQAVLSVLTNHAFWAAYGSVIGLSGLVLLLQQRKHARSESTKTT